MPLELQIIRASEFIRVGAQGHLDLAASREILRLLAGACWRRGIDRALLDLRALHPGPVPRLTPGDLAALVKAFCEMGFSDKLRLALLYSADPHHRARQFAFMTTLRGWNVKASKDFEEALLWLSQGERAEDRKEAGPQEIPVRRLMGRKPSGKKEAPLPSTGKADLPGRTRLLAETRKKTKTPPSNRRHPSSDVSKKASKKRKPKAGLPRA